MVQTAALDTPCRNLAKSNIQYAKANMNIKFAAIDAEMPSNIGIRLCLILSPSHPNIGDPAICVCVL